MFTTDFWLGFASLYCLCSACLVTSGMREGARLSEILLAAVLWLPVAIIDSIFGENW